MIPKDIHTINRFFLFTFALVCVILAHPSSAKAADISLTGTVSGGSTISITNAQFASAGAPSSGSYSSNNTLATGGTSFFATQGGSYSCGGGGCSPPSTENGFSFNASSFANGTYIYAWDLSDGNTYYAVFTVSGGSAAPVAPGPACGAGATRICGFTPENGTTLTGPTVDFTYDYYISPDDIGGFVDSVSDVVIKLHNIDQNVLLLGFASPGDIILYDKVATTSGAVHFATTTALADGNYRLEASIKRKFFFDWITVPGAAINQAISKQFIVGTPTLIGNLTQNGFNIINGIASSTTATSSVALVARCNPLGSFDIPSCLFGLFVPDTGQIQATIQGARDGILTRMPWGYLTRFMTIVSTSATTTLPSFTATVAQNNSSDTTTLTFDPADMLAGGGALLDSIHDPYNNKTVKDIFEPIIRMSVALVVLLTIVSDITGSHRHTSEPGEVASRRRRT